MEILVARWIFDMIYVIAVYDCLSNGETLKL